MAKKSKPKKRKVKRRIRPTLRQERAAARIVENCGNISKTMREVKYAAATAKNPKNLIDSQGFKVAARPFVEELRKEKELALRRMKKKRSRANYRDLTNAVEKLTKLEELLSGNPTERIEGLADLMKRALK